MEKVIILNNTVTSLRRFNTNARRVEFAIRPIPSGSDPIKWVRDAIKYIVLKTTEEAQNRDKVGFSFSCKSFNKEGWVPLRYAEEISVDDVWNIIHQIFQSNEHALDTDTFVLSTTIVNLPRGGRRNKKFNSFEEECKKRHGIIHIANRDNLCLARAVVVAIAKIEGDPEYNKILRDIKKIQSRKTLELLASAQLEIPIEGAGIPELREMQRFLTEYKITVYKYGCRGREPLFQGPDAEKKINLLHHNNHFNVITSLTAAFSCNHFCESCSTPFNDRKGHLCDRTCPGCRQSPPCTVENGRRCNDCHRYFRNHNCFEAHKKPSMRKTKSLCDSIRACIKCFKTIPKDRKHTCDEIFCNICHKHQPSNHHCFIQPDSGKSNKDDFLFIFYDLETRQEKINPDGSALHEPNLCVFKQRCNVCIASDVVLCVKCGMRLQIYRCQDPISPFIHHILQLRKKFKTVVVLAHNGSKFDHQFILNYFLSRTILKPEVIMRGTQIILLKFENVRFLDSLNYFPMALSKLPRAFGLEKN
ncbi:hypothetical protein JTB14_031598 [Gonioctena quinquepunctata]|nr:hypothetical protein JTB14_031598 [Gonioctena quinquepunctata]